MTTVVAGVGGARPRGCLVTGTDTGVGKTVLSATIVAALTARGERVLAHKPVVTGVDDEPGPWPADHELLGAVSGMDPDEVAPVRYGPPVSPHLGTELAGERLPAERVRDGACAALARAQAVGAALVVEGVGGLLVPLTAEYLVLDLACDLGLPVVVAARPGLGTINHSLLTVAAARARGLDVRAVVLGPWPDRPSAIERSNRETIGRLGRVEVHVLPPIAAPRAELLARAAEGLPLDDWLAPSEARGESPGLRSAPASAVRARR